MRISKWERVGGGGGHGPASSHSSTSRGGRQRVPYGNVTSPSLLPLPLLFSQLPHPNQQHHGLDSIYYPTPRHISGTGPPSLGRSIHTNLIFIFINNIRILHHYRHIFRVILNSNKCHLRYHPICQLQVLFQTLVQATGSPAATGGYGLVPSTSTTSSMSTSSRLPRNNNTSSSSSTSARSYSSSPSSRASSSIPLTILPYPLDSTWYYLLGQLEYYLSPVQDHFWRTQMCSLIFFYCLLFPPSSLFFFLENR